MTEIIKNRGKENEDEEGKKKKKAQNSPFS